MKHAVRSDVVDAIADECELTTAKASQALDAALTFIATTLPDRDVRLKGFGSFHRKLLCARKRHSPALGVYDMPKHYRLRFIPCPPLAAAVKSAEPPVVEDAEAL